MAVPMQTRLFPLLRTFEIGEVEKHTVTVRYGIWGRQTIWVDGKKAWSRFNWRNNSSVHLVVGEHERHDFELRVKGRPFHFSIWLDGAAHIARLFPGLTPSRVHTEGFTTWAPYLSAMMLIFWIVQGGMQETPPKALLTIAAFAALWTASVIHNMKRPRTWLAFAIFAVPILGMRDLDRLTPSGNSLVFFMFLDFGIIACLGPWLCRKIMIWHPQAAEEGEAPLSP
jgi:hypothetical protein